MEEKVEDRKYLSRRVVYGFCRRGIQFCDWSFQSVYFQFAHVCQLWKYARKHKRIRESNACQKGRLLYYQHEVRKRISLGRQWLWGRLFCPRLTVCALKGKEKIEWKLKDGRIKFVYHVSDAKSKRFSFVRQVTTLNDYFLLSVNFWCPASKRENEEKSKGEECKIEKLCILLAKSKRNYVLWRNWRLSVTVSFSG